MNNKHLSVINVVGLTKGLISNEHTPFINRLIKRLSLKTLKGAFPAVTTTAQSAMLTGKQPSAHGIVGNGWYFKDLAEVAFWKQANSLVQSPKIWEILKQKNPDFTCANSFWWYNMYSSVDYSMTPRPHYMADGSKILDLYSKPENLHQSIERKIGKFPFFNFWGPKAGIPSSQWIAKAAIEVQRKYMPNLHFIYLPHLDYNLQRLGPNDPAIVEDLRAIDKVVEQLCTEFDALNTNYILVSEYGITEVSQPIHINRILREKGYIKVRSSLNFELLDCGASSAFAVADHQIAHVYIKNKDQLKEVKALLENTKGIDLVLDKKSKDIYGINHERSGDLIAIADKEAWFTYYYWLDDKKAPDFARTIDIHRKPGYDPVEMFLDPNKTFIKAKIAWTILRKKLGFRYLLNVISLNPHLIKGSHGRNDDNEDTNPIIVAEQELIENCENIGDIYTLLENYFIK